MFYVCICGNGSVGSQIECLFTLFFPKKNTQNSVCVFSCVRGRFLGRRLKDSVPRETPGPPPSQTLCLPRQSRP